MFRGNSIYAPAAGAHNCERASYRNSCIVTLALESPLQHIRTDTVAVGVVVVVAIVTAVAVTLVMMILAHTHWLTQSNIINPNHLVLIGLTGAHTQTHIHPGTSGQITSPISYANAFSRDCSANPPNSVNQLDNLTLLKVIGQQAPGSQDSQHMRTPLRGCSLHRRHRNM